jgi:hypothetical protein
MDEVSKEQGASGLSIASLVTGILGLGIIPIILGAVDLSRIKNGVASEKGRGFDIAGIVLGSIELVIAIISIIISVVIGATIFYSFR